jgi:transcriptional regulator of acetoin/glycerol metabolism
MEPFKKENIELKEKIMKGIRLALDRLYEKAHKNGDELVVSDKKGNVIKIKP